MFCPKCGIENLGSNKFCKKCGKPLPSRAQIQQVVTQSYAMPPASSLIGQTLDGKYRIDGKLGSGGMGDVYKATRLLIGDCVAIKILHAHLASNPQAAERFRREAITATKLRHRNIVALYDVGISAVHNLPYLLMELAEGLTLRQIINSTNILPLEFAVTTTAQVCAALDEAHRLGIVHRDIKPENIIAKQSETGWHIKVLDFGIAKLYNQTDISLTQDGNTMGTPQYMSPEQCMGDALDARSDIYSVGIVLYEMLCGTVPFKSAAASAVTIYQVQMPPPPPRAINPNIASGVEAVILSALDKRRENRPQTASALTQELIKAATIAYKADYASNQIVVAPPQISEPIIPKPSLPLSSEILPEDYSSPFVVTEVLETVPSADSNEIIESENVVEKTEEFRVGEILEISAEEQFEAIEKTKTEEKTELLNFVGEKAQETERDENQYDLPLQMNVPTEVFVKPAESLDATDEREDLSQVFEDAELLLDELFPAEKSKLFQTDEFIAPVAPSQEILHFEDSRPITIPDEPLPSVENQEVNLQSAEVPFSKIESKSNNKMFLLVGAFSVIFFILFIGLVGFTWWLFSGNEKATVSNNNSSIENLSNSNTLTESQPNPNMPPGMAYIPGGNFMMGSDDGDEFEKPAHQVSVKPFFIDLTEVTCNDYKKFIDATNYKQPHNWKSRDIPTGWEKRPVTGVNWDDANAFAKWAGKRLPTEAEWEFAARGTDGRIYPWGNEWKENMANANGVSKEMKDVGSYQGQSPFGAFDMVGNAWEWTADDAKYYKDGKSILTATKTLSPKVIRGGYYENPKTTATVTFRRFWGARDEKDYGNSGFRCVKD